MGERVWVRGCVEKWCNRWCVIGCIIEGVLIGCVIDGCQMRMGHTCSTPVGPCHLA